MAIEISFSTYFCFHRNAFEKTIYLRKKEKKSATATKARSPQTKQASERMNKIDESIDKKHQLKTVVRASHATFQIVAGQFVSL